MAHIFYSDIKYRSQFKSYDIHCMKLHAVVMWMMTGGKPWKFLNLMIPWLLTSRIASISWNYGLLGGFTSSLEKNINQIWNNIIIKLIEIYLQGSKICFINWSFSCNHDKWLSCHRLPASSALAYNLYIWCQCWFTSTFSFLFWHKLFVFSLFSQMDRLTIISLHFYRNISKKK